MADSLSAPQILLTGATGFVGSFLYPALIAAGDSVRCATRRPAKARARYPDRAWVELDLDRPDTLPRALDGCDTAYYLVHGMAAGGDYATREQRAAEAFAAAAAEVGVRRVVYLGGVLPAGDRISQHLRSRKVTGEALRAGPVSTVELRAAMVIGHGSTSWIMVRDLAARLPAMVLPSWLRNTSYPVGIDDVVVGLLAASRLDDDACGVYGVPGPDKLTHREMLERTARALGHRRVMFNVPVLTPRLSSYWIALTTRVSLELARELVEGVRFDLVPGERSLWDVIHHTPMSIDAAVQLALTDERVADARQPGLTDDVVRRMQALGRQAAANLAG